MAQKLFHKVNGCDLFEDDFVISTIEAELFSDDGIIWEEIEE